MTTVQSPPPDAEPPLRDVRLLRLDELAAMGMAIAHTVELQVNRLTQYESVQAVAECLPRLTEAYTRLSRSIRQTIAFDTRLRTDQRRRAEAVLAAEQRLLNSRRHIIRRVENTIADTKTPQDREFLLRDFHERLDDPEFDEILTTCDLDTAFDHVTRDLGIGGTLPSSSVPRTRADVAALHARAAGSPAPNPSG